MNKRYRIQTFNTDTKEWQQLEGYPAFFNQQTDIKICQNYMLTWQEHAYRVVQVAAN